MTRLNLPLPPRLSSVPAIDRDALAWAALFKDQLEAWANGKLNIGNHPVAFGVATTVFTAAVFSAALTVTHGLGATPVVVIATSDLSGAASAYCEVGTFTATTFLLRAGDGQGVARTGNQNVFWLAIA